jgi:hypothetical protein
MHDCGPSSRCLPFASRGRGGRVAWLPLLFVGSMLFWTVALGLGGWSFMLVNEGALEMDMVGPSPTATETMPGAETGGIGGSERIPVQMEESTEPEDVNDNVGAVAVPAVYEAAQEAP